MEFTSWYANGGVGAEMEVYLRTFLTSTLDANECSVPRWGLFTMGKSPLPHCTRGLLGPRADLYEREWKNVFLRRGTKFKSPSPWRVEDFVYMAQSSWNVMAREGKWSGNWRMQWVASTLYTTSEHDVSSITTADAHNLAASSRLSWRPRRFKWTRPSRRKPKSGICVCAVTFMAHGDAREGKWSGNWRMQWVASTLHTTSEHGVSSITTVDAHNSAASSRLNWRPADINWLVRFAERRILVSARVPSYFKRSQFVR